MREVLLRAAGLALCLAVFGCQGGRLPDALFRCEAGACPEGFGCDADNNICRPGYVPVDAGATVDAGAFDAGPVEPIDAGQFRPKVQFDAGPPDQGWFGLGLDGGRGGAGVDGGFDAGVVSCAQTDPDEPDDQFTDSNCDGIDGDAANAAFVDAATGSDFGPGTRLAPYATIRRGLQSGKKQVLVSVDTYTANLTFARGRLFGGYDPNAGWVRGGDHSFIAGKVHITGDGQPYLADGGSVIIDGFTISPPAPSSSTGESSIAIELRNVGPEVVVRRTTLHASPGEQGADGTDGDTGDNATPGHDAIGGLGGVAAVATCAPSSTTNGFAGGQGGKATPDAGLSGLRGEPSTTSPLGGLGGQGFSCSSMACSIVSDDGQAGGDGANGSAGTDGDPGLEFGIVDGGWSPAVGASGTPGSPGRGGRGGGGGGGAVHPATSRIAAGGGGGGGSSGACGGQGGQGGVGGGASIAALLIDASPVFIDVAFEVEEGGRGGNGGSGGSSGNTAAGGNGAAGEDVDGELIGGAGGAGGRGGVGGPGGGGGGGAGGPSVGLYRAGTSSPTVINATFVVPSSGALGGSPNGASATPMQVYP